MNALLTTPLHDFHIARGGSMVEFAGWDMPVHYAAGLLAEHNHTREAASLFDVSHMGQVLLRGDTLEATGAALETLTPASVLGLKPWRQRYGLFTNTHGGILDDFMFANHETHWFLVVNAARTEHDLGLLQQVDGLEVEHVTNRALLAIQGPKAEAELARLVPGVTSMIFMDSKLLDWDGTELWVSRSGYTGEDGFEVSLPAERAVEFAEALLAGDVVRPAGLGARDSLRLEAGMCLYGHDLSPDVTPAQADLGWAVPKVRRPGGSRAGGYPGADIVAEELTDSASRVRVGLRPDGRAPIREGARIFADDTSTEPIAEVTSGSFSPTLRAPVAMAMLPCGYTVGDAVFAELRGKRVRCTVAELPFVQLNYKR